jgi:hypothetical protein
MRAIMTDTINANQALADNIIDTFLTERLLEKNNMDAHQTAFNSIIAVILSNPVSRQAFICLLLNRDFCLASIVSTLHTDSQINTFHAFLHDNHGYQKTSTNIIDESLFQSLSYSRLMTRLINKTADHLQN